jgi:hypothetical protein
MDFWRSNAKEENRKFNVSIWNMLRQVKGQSSNHESKFYLLLYPRYSKETERNKKGEPVKNNQFSALVTPARFEPATVTFVV